MKSETTKREFQVQGLDCADCAQGLEKAVCRVQGVTGARADFLKASLKVEYAPELVRPDEIARAIEKAGHRVAPEPTLSTTALTVEGMDCPTEEAQIRKALEGVAGIAGLDFLLISGVLTVRHDPALVDVDAIIRSIGKAGFRARVKRLEPAVPVGQGRQQLLLTALCGLLAGLGFALSWAGFGHPVTDPLYVAAIVTGGYQTARKGLAAARNLAPDMNLLMTIAVVGAVAIEEWTEAATVVFLFSLAGILENYSLERARRAIKSLLDLSPREATVRRDGREVTVAVEEVGLNETIIIRPGNKIPLDGTVLGGGSAVNQAPITGESVPVTKGPGDTVFAGSINERGALEVRVTHLAGDTTLARIIHMVEEAQAQKAPSQGFVDKFARYYTPAVIAGAVLVMALPPLVFGEPFSPWFYRALVLLVISCPCALVISTPVTIVSGLARAARQGILIKGGAHLENAGAIRVIAYDKTGTLTQGRPAVTQVVSLPGHTVSEVLGVAAAVENLSEHPLAQAIVSKAREAAADIPGRVEAFESLTGRGVRARLNGRTYYVGSHQLFTDLGLCNREVCARVQALEAESKTAVVVGSDEGPMGLIIIEDSLRPEAAEAIERLRQEGITRQVMLTGDNERVARSVAGRLGLDGYLAGLMPADKVGAVKRLLAEEGQVAMVGDGINDAPALATATLGIAMGAAGSDAAIEAADIALMSDDLGKLPLAMRLGRQARRTIKANITLALAAKGLFLALGVAGLATLWMAVLADMGTSLIVIFNGLRLFGTRE